MCDLDCDFFQKRKYASNERRGYMNVYILCSIIFLLTIFSIILLLEYTERKLKKKLEQQIESLNKDDFDIINETKTGALYIYPENSQNRGGGIEFVNRKLDLDGNIKVGIAVPLNSILVMNDDCIANDWNEIIGVNTHLRISEQQYSKYLDLVKGCDVTSTTSFYLDIKLSNAKVISRINKCNEWFGTKIVTQYRFERYNVLNLITDMQPFSDDEISDLINKIKDRMIERLHM